MKRLLIILLSLLLLLACVPTPEEDAVVNKAETTVVFADTDVRIRETLDAVPTQWNAEFTFREGSVAVTVDAVIETPEIERFPIVEVKPAPIDSQIAAKLLYKLIPGGSIRISDHGGQAYSLEDIDQWIEEVKNQIEHTSEMTFDSVEERDAYINTQNTELERLFDLRKTAESGKVEMLKDYELLGKCGAMECRILDADGRECANFMWKPQSGENNDKRESVLHIDSLLPSCGLLDHGVLNRDEAVEAADNLIGEIGLDDRYVCVSVMEGINSIRCCYGLRYGGIASSPLTETIVDFVSAYNMPWPNEMLLVSFAKQEGRTSVSYVCPSEFVGEIGSAELLSFAEIQSQFEKNMKASYSWFDESTLSADISVCRISLGYYRVPLKDQVNRYVMIPAWTFEGTRMTETKSDDGTGTFLLQDDLPNNVLMIISGLDGSLLYAG